MPSTLTRPRQGSKDLTKVESFVKFSKFDAQERMVYGIATSETVDLQDEIIDYDGIKEAWPDYIKFGNVRAMHNGNMSAVGVIKDYEFLDDKRQVRIGVYVADDQDWSKVVAGIYKGFSIGAEVIKYIMDRVGETVVRRVTQLRLTEISLVDRPACPDALIEFFKVAHNSRGGQTLELNFRTMQKAVQLYRNEAELKGKQKQVANLNILRKMIAKCGDVALADGDDASIEMKDDGTMDLQEDDNTNDLQMGDGTDDLQMGDDENDLNMAFGDDDEMGKADDADYLQLVKDLAGLIGGYKGDSIVRAADGGMDMDKDDSGLDLDKDDDMDTLTQSLHLMQKALDEQGEMFKGLMKTVQGTAVTVSKMAGQPAPTQISKMNMRQEITADPGEALEKSAMVTFLTEKIRWESRDKIRAQYEAELAKLTSGAQ